MLKKAALLTNYGFPKNRNQNANCKIGLCMTVGCEIALTCFVAFAFYIIGALIVIINIIKIDYLATLNSVESSV